VLIGRNEIDHVVLFRLQEVPEVLEGNPLFEEVRRIANEGALLRAKVNTVDLAAIAQVELQVVGNALLNAEVGKGSV